MVTAEIQLAVHEYVMKALDPKNDNPHYKVELVVGMIEAAFTNSPICAKFGKNGTVKGDSIAGN